MARKRKPRPPTLKEKALALLEASEEPISAIALGQDIGCSDRVATRIVQELRLCGVRVDRITGYRLHRPRSG